MIHASFDARNTQTAAISGAAQYDTGQRIRMSGLPSPEELAAADELLSGETVTVQAQYGFEGDEQSEPRLATYDEETGTWLAEVPDVYLTRAQTVNVYVYVMHGSTLDQGRAKTMYRGAFTPQARSAPGTAVTPAQKNAWDALAAEVNLALSEMGTAGSEARAMAQLAAEAAGAAAAAAKDAREAAETLSGAWENASASAVTLEPGSAVTAEIQTAEDGAKRFVLGVPRGEKGEKGDTGPAGVTFRLEGATLYIDTD